MILTASGEKHGLLQTLPNSVSFDDFKNLSAKNREEKRKEKIEDGKMVRARYINHQEQERGRLCKPYCRYAGDPIRLYNLIHDYDYEVPYGFVKEVNESRLAIREGLQSVDGKEVTASGAPLNKDQSIRVHELVPVSFK